MSPLTKPLKSLSEKGDRSKFFAAALALLILVLLYLKFPFILYPTSDYALIALIVFAFFLNLKTTLIPSGAICQLSASSGSSLV